MARELKDSGIEWIGQIPKEWDLIRLKFITDINSGEIISKEEYETEGKYPIIGSNGEIGRLNKKNNNNQVVTTGRVGTIGTTHLVKDAWITDNALIIYPNNICGHYLYYVVPLFDYKLMLSGTAQPLITSSKLKNQITPFPTLSTQQHIANFLDSKCAEIDELIALQETMIEELKAYKQSVITEAVTKGLNPDALMRNSGIDWIGEIPEHWKLEPLKYCFDRRSEKNNPVKTEERLSLSIDKGVTLYSEKTTNLDRFKEDFTQYQLAYPNDIVLNCMNMIVGAVGLSNYMGCVSPVYYVIYPIRQDINPLYYSYLLNIPTIRGVYYSLGKGIYAIERGEGRVNTCRLKVAYNDFGRLEIPVPPLEEQKEITRFIQQKCSEIDSLITLKQTKIEELKEYKKSVIYEYVTGKKEVN